MSELLNFMLPIHFVSQDFAKQFETFHICAHNFRQALISYQPFASSGTFYSS